MKAVPIVSFTGAIGVGPPIRIRKDTGSKLVPTTVNRISPMDALNA